MIMKVIKNTKALATIKIASIFGLLSLLVSSCVQDDFQKLQPRKWVLTWSDEFEGSLGALPDTSKWSFDIGTGIGGWGNQELQYYTNRPENISTDGNGNLVITVLNQPFGGSPFTSSRIKTKSRFDQAYGRFEARLKTPYGPGLWPAFWLLGSNVDQVSWPNCGEIDIMELRGQEPHVIQGSIHGPGYSGGNSISKRFTLSNNRFDLDFHVFAIEWSEQKIDFFVDDFLYQRIERADVPGEWVYDHPFFILLNVAVGGNYVGFPTAQTPFPQKMVVDYVRVYQSVSN
jgi:beta-glucanase (GH16 family)